MNNTQSQSWWDSRLFWQWVLASTLGWSAGWAIGGTIVRNVALYTAVSLRGPMFVIFFGSVAGLLAGAGVGGAQWLILRRHLPRAYWWLLATIAGWWLAGGASLLVFWAIFGRVYGLVFDIILQVASLGIADIAASLVVGLIGWGIVGSLAGLVQWLYLRRHIPKAGWWVAASGGAFAAAMVIAYNVVSRKLVLSAAAAGSDWAEGGTMMGAGIGATAGLVYGIVMALSLLWLSRRVRR